MLVFTAGWVAWTFPFFPPKYTGLLSSKVAKPAIVSLGVFVSGMGGIIRAGFGPPPQCTAHLAALTLVKRPRAPLACCDSVRNVRDGLLAAEPESVAGRLGGAARSRSRCYSPCPLAIYEPQTLDGGER